MDLAGVGNRALVPQTGSFFGIVSCLKVIGFVHNKAVRGIKASWILDFIKTQRANPCVGIPKSWPPPRRQVGLRFLCSVKLSTRQK